MDWKEKLEQIENALHKNTSEIANTIGVTPRYLFDIKKGRSKNPTAKLPELLLLKLNINPIWLFTDKGEMFLESHNSETITYQGMLPLLIKLGTLSPEEKEKVSQFIDELKK